MTIESRHAVYLCSSRTGCRAIKDRSPGIIHWQRTCMKGSPLRALLFLSLWLAGVSPGAADVGFLPVKSVEAQPLATATERLIEALDYVGAPIAPAERKTLESGLKERDPDKLAAIVQEVFDPYCVAGVKIGP